MPAPATQMRIMRALPGVTVVSPGDDWVKERAGAGAAVCAELGRDPGGQVADGGVEAGSGGDAVRLGVAHRRRVIVEGMLVVAGGLACEQFGRRCKAGGGHAESA